MNLPMTATKESVRFVCYHRDCGPYYKPENEVVEIDSLTRMVSFVRNLMEDDVDHIAVFDSSWKCTGVWIADAEPEPDGEGGWMMPRPVYVLHRPDTRSKYSFDVCVRSFKPPAGVA